MDQSLKTREQDNFPPVLWENLPIEEKQQVTPDQLFQCFGKLTDTSAAIVDTDRLTVSWLFNRLSGYNWQKQDHNRPIILSDMIHPRDLSRLLNDIDYFRRFKAESYESLYRISDFQGDYNWDLVRSVALKYDKIGRPTFIMIFIRHLNHAINNSNFLDLSAQEHHQQKANMINRRLTSREQEILALIGEAMSDDEIADHLMISRKTVITHRRNLLKKLNAKNKLELVKIAIENGLTVK
ncbi:MAG: LuxR C-terminal-related transcriptional regulator [Bacteroidota bacterium]